jgi:molybdopterin synthase sulfur carrier subunit
MPISVKIPTPLRGLTNGEKTVEAKGKTVSDVLLDLDTRYPGIRDKLYDNETMRLFINIFINDEDIRTLNRAEGRYEIDLNTPVKNGDQLYLIPPIAGGKGRE